MTSKAKPAPQSPATGAPAAANSAPSLLSLEQLLKEEEAMVRARRSSRPGNRSSAAPLTGLALSGGGIRSAAVCLGALQALEAARRLNSFDYISSVSGGGYTGTCLNLSLSAGGGGKFPFGEDVNDSPVVSHLRNYSNYLLPRDRSPIKNWLQSAIIIARGLLANFVATLAFLIPAVIILVIAYPDRQALGDPNVLLRFWSGMKLVLAGAWHSPMDVRRPEYAPFYVPRFLAGMLALLLIVWAAVKSWPSLDQKTDDTKGVVLGTAFWLAIAGLALLAIDLQPRLIKAVMDYSPKQHRGNWIATALSLLSAAMTAIGTLAGFIGRYLQRTARDRGRKRAIGRLLARAVLAIGALILPVLLWLSVALLYAWTIHQPFSIYLDHAHISAVLTDPPRLVLAPTRFTWLLLGGVIAVALSAFYDSNNFSLHWLYRDRLSKAFLVAPPGAPGAASKRRRGSSSADMAVEFDRVAIWDLQESVGPYPLYNTALNLQGSLRANMRGRNADFFVFTPHYFGSELTGYVSSEVLKEWDSRLDVGAVMAISGAAASANMGSHTNRLLSPTLALLNIRLGYYLKNPKYVHEGRSVGRRLWSFAGSFISGFFLLNEMFNLLDENKPSVFLSDGGHIENLGIYELLRRQCDLIVAIDAEADPDLSCGSLLLLERYARIDLGIRITLPWEAVAKLSNKTSKALEEDRAPECRHGPHCAVGRIRYKDGTTGVLVYVKASLSGDERDYVLDYARRYPEFPDEPTADQFFSEEQFEMYRALGFHMVEGLFGTDSLSIIRNDLYSDNEAARAAINDLLPVS